MKQQNAFKLLAAFMIVTMIVVPVAYVVTSPRSDTIQRTNGQETQKNNYDPYLWRINEPFNSISDALNMTPYGTVTANYMDTESMTLQMIQLTSQTKVDLIDYPIISWMDFIYKSNTTQVYYSHLSDGKNESFLLLSKMSPERNDFEYIVSPYTHGNHYLLIRQDQGLNGLYNVMGTPVIFAPPQTAIDTLDIITSLNKTTTAYDQYEGLLSRVEPAPYQTIDSGVDFADQFYMGIRDINGDYERTTAYLNVNSSTLEKLRQLEANSTQRGFAQYNITQDGNYTIIKILGPDLFKVSSEEIS
ncbi:hypothetical protein ANME2D_01947 [Candidatus Methanoperedens nitroreducens]|uniref:Uncharacterized protein n=1 Tax=Candidatus Methanoperedens nitratireducens TaxID=1392998 RepID=A0A062UY62_9EURY|nr:hypothetical protein [Candidatus Methanoperedens nitroreducens]KCZ71891.1 hypothetical protein ANME2D_01947 [Candidatus Methanoperedens nitroreducens]MDJ1422136.1 hypothetical protein [Candidatus Methanoperedens sp.]